MLNCFTGLRAQGHEKIAHIGSDSPDLPLAYLQRAFGLLDSTEMIIGGGPDSGFYLIGASVVPPKPIFDGITWSSGRIMSQLHLNLENPALGRSSISLLVWRDVDNEHDWGELEHRLFNLNTHAPHTREFLTAHRGTAQSRT